jgi:hypothetical protein
MSEDYGKMVEGLRAQLVLTQGSRRVIQSTVRGLGCSTVINEFAKGQPHILITSRLVAEGLFKNEPGSYLTPHYVVKHNFKLNPDLLTVVIYNPWRNRCNSLHRFVHLLKDQRNLIWYSPDSLFPKDCRRIVLDSITGEWEEAT